jgi:hypothetical protein
MLATNARFVNKILPLHPQTEPERLLGTNQSNSREKRQLALYTKRRNLLPQEYQERSFFYTFQW